MLIRDELPSDVDAIAAVVESAFGSPAEAALVEAIRASGLLLASLVAVDGADVVGHVMLSQGRVGERPIAMLTPLAVAPARQRSGIGRALVSAVVARAEALGEGIVVLEGDPGYYTAKLGWEPASAYGLTLPLPSWAPVEAAQAWRLPAYDPTLRGEVVYPAAFAPFSDP